MSFSAHVAGLEELSPELMAAARLGIHDGMELLGVEGTRMVQDNIGSPYNGKPAAVDTGNLINSPISNVYEEQAVTRLVIGVNEANPANAYAGPVETGSVPHMPPVEALVPWVMRKLDPRDEKQALSMAWGVAKAIKKRGQPQGVEMFERAQVDLERLTVPTLERSIGARLLATGDLNYTGGLA